MKFACLVYHEQGKLDSLPEREIQGLVAECGAWVEELKKNGHHVMSLGLQSVETSTTLRSRAGRLAMTDGPFAETQEQLGGLTIIEAADLDEALRLAAKMPAVRISTIEVRPVLNELPQH